MTDKIVKKIKAKKLFDKDLKRPESERIYSHKYSKFSEVIEKIIEEGASGIVEDHIKFLESQKNQYNKAYEKLCDLQEVNIVGESTNKKYKDLEEKFKFNLDFLTGKIDRAIKILSDPEACKDVLNNLKKVANQAKRLLESDKTLSSEGSLSDRVYKESRKTTVKSFATGDFVWEVTGPDLDGMGIDEQVLEQFLIPRQYLMARNQFYIAWHNEKLDFGLNMDELDFASASLTSLMYFPRGKNNECMPEEFKLSLHNGFVHSLNTATLAAKIFDKALKRLNAARENNITEEYNLYKQEDFEDIKEIDPSISINSYKHHIRRYEVQETFIKQLRCDVIRVALGHDDIEGINGELSVGNNSDIQDLEERRRFNYQKDKFDEDPEIKKIHVEMLCSLHPEISEICNRNSDLVKSFHFNHFESNKHSKAYIELVHLLVESVEKLQTTADYRRMGLVGYMKSNDDVEDKIFGVEYPFKVIFGAKIDKSNLMQEVPGMNEETSKNRAFQMRLRAGKLIFKPGKSLKSSILEFIEDGASIMRIPQRSAGTEDVSSKKEAIIELYDVLIKELKHQGREYCKKRGADSKAFINLVDLNSEINFVKENSRFA
jgi:hypothetical protein